MAKDGNKWYTIGMTSRQKEAIDKKNIGYLVSHNRGLKWEDIVKFAEKPREFDNSFLYIVKCHDFYKIGRAYDIKSRIINLQCGNPYKLELFYSRKVRDARLVEMILHHKFEGGREKGEWFRLEKEHLDEIMNYVDNCSAI